LVRELTDVSRIQRLPDRFAVEVGPADLAVAWIEIAEPSPARVVELALADRAVGELDPVTLAGHRPPRHVAELDLDPRLLRRAGAAARDGGPALPGERHRLRVQVGPVDLAVARVE